MNNVKNFDLYLTGAWSKYIVKFDTLAGECDQLFGEAALSKGTSSEAATRDRLICAKRRFAEAVQEFCQLIGETDGELEDKLIRLYANLHKGVHYVQR